MSAKSLDKKNRWRNKTVGFRVSPDEWDEIERLVRLSGMSKQDYIMSRLKNKEITVTANPRIFKALKNEMIDLTEELKRLSEIPSENQETMDFAKILVSFMQMMTQ